MIAANLVSGGKAFDQEENALLILTKDEKIELPQTQKNKLARQLIELIAGHFASKRGQ
jgi:phosphopantothenoylcysteine synthetase/decarboxylase